jgi:hypothetical protein
MKIPPLGDELFYADWQKDSISDEADRFFPLQAVKLCVELVLYVHVFLVFLLSPTSLISMKEYPVPNE